MSKRESAAGSHENYAHTLITIDTLPHDKPSRKTRTRRAMRPSASSPTSRQLAGILHDLETAQDALAHAANDLASLARSTEAMSPKAAVRFALSARTACSITVDLYKSLTFWQWHEQIQLARRQQVWDDAMAARDRARGSTGESEAA